MEKTIKRKTTDGLIWNTIERLVSKGFQFVFSILIARILIPEDYGLIAIANLFISLSDVLIDSGLSKALIRDNNKTKEAFNTVFWFNIAVSCLLYLILFLIAPIIAAYYQSPQLSSLIRVISVSLILNAICGVQSLHLVIAMDFRKLAVFETLAMAIGGLTGLFFAMRGAGVWALVIQTLTGNTIRTVFIWIWGGWRPSIIFSRSILGYYFAFGSRLLISDYINRVYSSIFTLKIGKAFSPTQLGFYGKADAFASVPSSVISGPLSSVTLPALAEIQQEDERIQRNYDTMVELSSFLLFPVFFGIVAISGVLVPVLLTEKWNGVIPLLQILSFSYLFGALTIFPNNLLMLQGNSKAILRIQLITKVIGLCLLFPLSRIALSAVCWVIVFVSFLTWILSIICLKVDSNYRIGRMFTLIMPSMVISVVMMIVVYIITLWIRNATLGLIIGILSGFLIYAGLSFLCNRKQLRQLKELVLPYLNH